MLWHKVQGAGATPRLWTNPDLTNATYDGVSLGMPFSANTLDLEFKTDGSKLYVTDTPSSRLIIFDLSTPWDLSSASLDTTDSFTGIIGISFKPDGSRMFWANNFNDTLNQVDLSTPWDTSTAGSPSVGAPYVGVFVRGVEFSRDGTKMYSSDANNQRILQFNLSTPWDITSPSASTTPDKTFDASAQQIGFLVAFSPDGEKFWAMAQSSDSLYEYDMATPWDISTSSYSGISLDVSSQETTPTGGSFKVDGSKFYFTGIVTDDVFQYSTA